jgi:hypothetical protein
VATGLLCPGCTLRDQDTPLGLCASCVVERAAENYSAEDRRAVQLRRSEWAKARAGNPHVVLRQQRKRLTEAIRPKRPDPGLDPWHIAGESLAALERMRGKDPVVLEEVAEALRRLAWGPD